MSRGFIRKDQVLEKLRVGRDGAKQVCIEAKINSPEYNQAQAIMEAIDDMAELLTGDRTYYYVKMAPASQQPKGPE